MNPSFHPHNNLMRCILLSLSISRWRNSLRDIKYLLSAHTATAWWKTYSVSSSPPCLTRASHAFSLLSLPSRSLAPSSPFSGSLSTQDLARRQAAAISGAKWKNQFCGKLFPGEHHSNPWGNWREHRRGSWCIWGVGSIFHFLKGQTFLFHGENRSSTKGARSM